MADKQEQVSSLIHSIPFGNLIGGPLSACISAQADAAQVALNYVRAVSMKRLDNGDNDDEAIFEPETISFSFVVNGQPRVMIVPLLTIIPVPFIRIEHVDLSFTADITASDKNKFEAKYTAPNREQVGEETTEVQVENVIEVDIHAVTSEMPSGLARLLEVFSTQLFQVEDMTPDEVEKIRQTNQIAPAAETPQPEPLKPAVHTESEKKRLRDAYKKYMKEGRYKEAREKRNQIIWTHTGVEARTLLRASTKPDANIPWMIRVTESLQDNPDCEYDPKLSLAENIRQQEKLQKTNRKKLRSDLLFAMKLAKKMYPNTIDSTKGKMVFKDVWKKHTHFKNGWYTFGGTKEEGALKYFVNWIILLEKEREKKAAAQQPAQQSAPQPSQQPIKETPMIKITENEVAPLPSKEQIAAENAKKAAEEKAKKEAEEKAKKEAEAKAKKEAQEKAAKEALAKAQKEAAEKLKKEAEEKAKKEAEEKAKAETLAKAKAATEELIKKMNAAKEAEEKAKKEAEAKAKKEALEKAAKEALAKAQKEAAEKLKKEAEEKAKKEAEEKAKEKAKKEMAEKAKNALEEIKKRVSEATNTSIKRVPTLTRKTRKK